MVAFDNAIHNLSLVATSPSAGSVADLSVTLNIQRSANNETSIIAAQQAIMDAYGPRYPSLTTWPSVEISRVNPHVIPFGVAPFWPAQKPISDATASTWYPQMIADVHAKGGIVSWNHPFGATAGPMLTQANQDAKRRSVFATMLANGRYGTDLLEVGYQLRGQVNALSHLALWDTFSRYGIFITGTGVNDNHDGQNWAAQKNGFATGIWAASTTQSDVVAALLAGRAFTYHLSRWPGAALDMVADTALPMGCVVVDGKASHTLTIQALALPGGSKLDVIAGPVDSAGSDPGTTTLKTFSAAALGAGGLATLTVDTTTSCFVRTQVRDSSGLVIGIGQPIWFLTAPPPAGIPAARVPVVV
jgi:hypothetical protein